MNYWATTRDNGLPQSRFFPSQTYIHSEEHIESKGEPSKGMVEQ